MANKYRKINSAAGVSFTEVKLEICLSINGRENPGAGFLETWAFLYLSSGSPIGISFLHGSFETRIGI